MVKFVSGLFLFLCFVLIGQQVIAGTRSPEVEDSKYIEYGSQHKCVLPICGILGDKLNSQFKASCVMIDEYHFITAAHVIMGSITQHVIYNNEAYPCAILAAHIDFDFDKIGSNDIAIGRLQRPIKLDFYPELYTDKDEKDKICSISGYGFPGTFKTGYIQSKFDNIRRAGSNIIDESSKYLLKISAHKGTKTSLEFLISPGDSGGGLFINQKLAGINSYVYATDGKSNADYGDISCHTRISTHADWIEKTKKIIEKMLNNEGSDLRK